MRRSVDYPFLTITLILLIGGLLVVSSASVVISQENFGTSYYYLWHQAGAAAVGLVGLVAFQAIHYRVWKRLALPLLVASLLLIAAVLLPGVGVVRGGAARWLDIGPLSLQPSEILKLSLILYLASWLDRRKAQLKSFASAFVPFLAIVGIVAVLLILQPDIGTLAIIAGSATVLYFLGGGRLPQLAAFAILAIAGLAAVIQLAPYRVARLLVFLNPSLDPQGIGYHLSQALIAIGSGGFWGKGFGQSIQKFSYLPEPIGDSVFAVMVEEFGFLGAVITAALFFAWLLRAIAIARHTTDFFGKLLVAGLASTITLQAFIHMAAISGLLPLTGIPLPFFSYGGTALVMTLAMVGIILNVSKHT